MVSNQRLEEVPLQRQITGFIYLGLDLDSALQLADCFFQVLTQCGQHSYNVYKHRSEIHGHQIKRNLNILKATDNVH